jgi:arylsulfatase A-like enzyme
LNQAYAHHYYPEYLWRNEEKIGLPGNKNGKQEQYVQDLFTEDGLEFIEDNSKKPFFIFFAYTTPHAELLVPEDSLAEFKGKFPEKPFVRGKQGGDGSGAPFGVYDSQATPKAAFAAMITRFDRDVGRIMAKLKKMGLDKDTIVMFTSDNGPHLEGGADPDFFNSSGPLKGRKRDLYEGGIRVPMIARWPGRIKAGTRTDHVSAFWDVLPTCADIAGAKSPGEIDGLSFLPTLLGKEEDQKKHKYLYWEFHENKVTEQAVRMGNFKAVRHGPNKEIELYDLETDIAEKHNIAEEHPEKVKIIERYLNRTRTDSKIWPLLY